MTPIVQALQRLFQFHRLVFWYDESAENHETFQELELEDVVKLPIQDNEFQIKHRLLIEEPQQKFLLYSTQAKPAKDENWLLDLLLANKEFKADQVTLLQIEFNLADRFLPLLYEHQEYFRAKDRRQAFQNRISQILEPDDLVMQLMTILCKQQDASIENILWSLFAEMARGGDREIWGQFAKYKLTAPFWQQLQIRYGYHSATPSLENFISECWRQIFKGKSNLNDPTKQASLMLRRWRKDNEFLKDYLVLSELYASDLGFAKDRPVKMEEWLDKDEFAFIERYFMSQIIDKLCDPHANLSDLKPVLEARKASFWYKAYQHQYQAIEHSWELRTALGKAYWNFDNATAFLSYYSQNGWQIDYHYRKFVHAYEQANNDPALEQLAKTTELFYCNRFLHELNSKWMPFVENKSFLEQRELGHQRNFFQDHVRPFVQKKQPVFVIISDAFRYETGQDLANQLKASGRGEVKLTPMVSMLPSYTRAGMAALLPHKTLECEIHTDTIFADGKNVGGTEGRSSVLASTLQGRGTAVSFEELRKLTQNREEGREWAKQYDVVYVYHNTIDLAGDKRISESTVFEATERAFQDIQRILTILGNINRTNVLITADHGYLYQQSDLKDADFIAGDLPYELKKINRRFLYGEQDQGQLSGFHKFGLSELGLVGQGYCWIPKSILRIRRQGSGSRFVHGGASLQELVIPVIHFNRKRENIAEPVEISVLNLRGTISTNIFAVQFYQASPVRDNVTARRIRAALYAQDGTKLSDEFEHQFDSSSEDANERTKTVKFNLTSDAAKYSSQNVTFLIEEMKSTGNWAEYESRNVILSITFENEEW